MIPGSSSSPIPVPCLSVGASPHLCLHTCGHAHSPAAAQTIHCLPRRAWQDPPSYSAPLSPCGAGISPPRDGPHSPNIHTLPQPAPPRARTLEARKRWARLAQARAASRPGLCATAPGRTAGAPPLCPVFLPGESSWTEEPGGPQSMRSESDASKQLLHIHIVHSSSGI